MRDDIPSFLGSPVTFTSRLVASPPRGGHAAPSGGHPTRSAKTLNFTIENQRLGNWCWAAIASSVATFYGRRAAWTQCKIASSCLGMACCNNPVPGACDDTHYLDRALTLVGHLATTAPVMGSGPPSIAVLQNEINVSRPLCAHIDWGNGADGHFVALSGYDPVNSEVRVEDPDGATQTWMAFSKVCSSYPGGGTWSYTYWTA